MPARHVVVDGSNIATEGSSLPSLQQLDEAVREFIRENPDDVVTVVVDATFGHRIPAEERRRFEEAELAGEVVSPPAGAIGRGDAFLLRVADKVGASVLSNDSFQEFHGDYEWLFDKGRLVGGKPVPGVGWIFTPRTPVRGPKSRESVKEAKRKKRGDQPEAAESGLDMAAERAKARGGERKLQRAIATAVDEAVEPAKTGRKRRRRTRGGEAPSDPLNEPFSFISFIASNHLGDEVEGTVDEFSSHGAFILVDGARCYLPLSAMGDPAPRSARDILRRGETGRFVVQAYDAMRRGIELAMPGFAKVSGVPTPETVEAEIHRKEEGVLDVTALAEPISRRRRRRTAGVAGTEQAALEAPPLPAPAPRRQKQVPPAPAPVAARGRATKEQVAVPERAAATTASGAPPTSSRRRRPLATSVVTVPEKAPATKVAAKKAAARRATTGQMAKPARAPKVAPAKVAAAKVTAAKPVPPKKATPKVAAAKQAASKTRAPKTPATKTAATKTAVTKRAATRTATAPTGTAKKGAARTAKTSTVKAGTAKTSPAQAGIAKAPAKGSAAKAATGKKAQPNKVAAKKQASMAQKAVTRSPAGAARSAKPSGPGKAAVPAEKATPAKAAVAKNKSVGAKKAAPVKSQKAQPAKPRGARSS